MAEEVIVYEAGEGPDRPLVERINATLNRELADPKTVGALLATTFKGLDANNMKRALMEGMIRGFEFRDFLVKDVYAVPFAQGYSLVTSIDHARKRGMRSGVIGKTAPEYTYDKDGKVTSCSITIKRLVQGHVGEFTSLVDFKEYTTGKNLWTSKPKTMIAKVAEMHALRMACPDELAQAYVEEEFESESVRNGRFVDAKANSASLKMGSLENHGKEEIKPEAEGHKNGTQHVAEGNEEQDNATPPD